MVLFLELPRSSVRVFAFIPHCMALWKINASLFVDSHVLFFLFRGQFLAAFADIKTDRERATSSNLLVRFFVDTLPFATLPLIHQWRRWIRSQEPFRIGRQQTSMRSF